MAGGGDDITEDEFEALLDQLHGAGKAPTPHGPVELRWEKQGARLNYCLVVPPGYQVKIDNRSGRQLVREP